MLTLVIYDVSDNNLRNLVSEILKDFGGVRVQKSAFLLNIDRNRRGMLQIELTKALGDQEGNIQLYPLTKTSVKMMAEIGEREYDWSEEEL
jgi:CRISPR-associated protein Cas2